MSITLQKEALAQPFNGQSSWPLRVTAISSDPRLSSAIFVYHASMKDDPYEGDIFEAVASVSQMLELPEEAGIAEDCNGKKIPYYRLSKLEFFCHSAWEMEDLWQKIQGDTNDLVRNFYAFNRMQPAESVTFTPETP